MKRKPPRGRHFGHDCGRDATIPAPLLTEHGQKVNHEGKGGREAAPSKDLSPFVRFGMRTGFFVALVGTSGPSPFDVPRSIRPLILDPARFAFGNRKPSCETAPSLPLRPGGCGLVDTRCCEAGKKAVMVAAHR